MITNDHSSRNISVFYKELKDKFVDEFSYWPPFEGIVTDKCWAQIKSIVELNNGLDVVQYLNIVYRYATEQINDLFEYMDRNFVYCFLCIVHLSKNFLKDLNSMLDDAKDKRIAKIFFVEMVHCRSYPTFKKIFEQFCHYYLSQNDSDKERLLYSLHHNDSFWQTVETDETDMKQYNDEIDSDTIYQNSKWYKDCLVIYKEKLKTYNHRCSSKETLFIEYIMQHYVALAPMWTSILHIRKSDTKPHYEENFRCSTGNMESHWGTTKEDLRTRIAELGKLPIAAERLIAYMKSQTRANVVRYREKIPKCRLNARKGTYKRKRTDVKEPKTNKSEDITLSELGEIKAEWGRTPTSVRTIKQKFSNISGKRLFAQRFKDLPSLKIPPNSGFNKIFERISIMHPGKRLYFGKKNFQNRTISLDLADLRTVIEGWIVDSAVEWLIAAEIEAAGRSEEIYLLEPYSAAVLFSKNNKNNDLAAAEYRRMVGHPKILVPFCDGSHYFLIMVNFRTQDFFCWDSQQNEKSAKASDFFSIIKNIAKITGDDQRWATKWLVEDMPCSQQKDNSSCGIYCVEFSKEIIQNKGCNDLQIDPKTWRHENYKKNYLQCYFNHPCCTLCGAWMIAKNDFDLICKTCPMKVCATCSDGTKQCKVC
ncbi:uncharacterized protein LOC110675776 [Aedes aegypti]|nr:uncharacterized protein LOC110675776 [Aedes aegypti]